MYLDFLAFGFLMLFVFSAYSQLIAYQERKQILLAVVQLAKVYCGGAVSIIMLLQPTEDLNIYARLIISITISVIALPMIFQEDLENIGRVVEGKEKRR